MTTASISRHHLADWSQRLCDHFKADLDQKRAAWVAHNLGKRYGFLWRHKWTEETAREQWPEDHSSIPYELWDDEHSAGISIPVESNLNYLSAKSLLEMAEAPELSEFRLDLRTSSWFSRHLTQLTQASA
jgi:hypothetical protein